MSAQVFMHKEQLSSSNDLTPLDSGMVLFGLSEGVSSVRRHIVGVFTGKHYGLDLF